MSTVSANSAGPAESADPAAFWEALLSSEPTRIAAAWQSLAAAEAEAVRAHLQTMATESGWAPVQRQAAADALRVIAAL